MMTQRQYEHVMLTAIVGIYTLGAMALGFLIGTFIK